MELIIMTKLNPNKYGNYPCPHCSNILTPILREWMKPPMVTDYICHHCQVGFKIKIEGNYSLNGFLLRGITKL